MPRLYETVFPEWMLFYILGMDCKHGVWNNIIKRVNGYWLTGALALSLTEAFVLMKVGCAAGFAASQIKFSSFLYAVVFTMTLIKKEKNVQRNMLSLLGDNSYGIFFLHMLVLLVVQKVLNVIGLSKMWGVYFLLCFILSAVGSYLAVAIIKLIAEKIALRDLLKFIEF